MAVGESPPQVLLGMHVGFGFVGYLLLIYCLIGWIRTVERSMRIRVGFIVIWGVAYLAGVAMAVHALFL